jgi:hypothetical protein
MLEKESGRITYITERSFQNTLSSNVNETQFGIKLIPIILSHL